MNVWHNFLSQLRNNAIWIGWIEIQHKMVAPASTNCCNVSAVLARSPYLTISCTDSSILSGSRPIAVLVQDLDFVPKPLNRYSNIIPDIRVASYIRSVRCSPLPPNKEGRVGRFARACAASAAQERPGFQAWFIDIAHNRNEMIV